MFWVDKEAEYISSAIYSIFDPIPDSEGFMHESYNKSLTPSIIHMFDRICPLRMFMYDKCPQVQGIPTDYSRNRQYFIQPCTQSAQEIIDNSWNSSICEGL